MYIYVPSGNQGNWTSTIYRWFSHLKLHWVRGFDKASHVCQRASLITGDDENCRSERLKGSFEEANSEPRLGLFASSRDVAVILLMFFGWTFSTRFLSRKKHWVNGFLVRSWAFCGKWGNNKIAAIFSTEHNDILSTCQRHWKTTPVFCRATSGGAFFFVVSPCSGGTDPAFLFVGWRVN